MTTRPTRTARATSLRLYNCLDAMAPRAVLTGLAASGHSVAQVRLWIVATSPTDAAWQLSERLITPMAPIGGPLRQNSPFAATWQNLGLDADAAVYAFGFPPATDGPLLRVDAADRVEQVAVLGDVLEHLAVRG
jgi:hypothetical protein